ncbi:hypothetical protein GETHLI_25690 [Geothrix limicola]|uniref:DUF721 domain-containing protein n=1 Tax=Geothrix limicola TaxID=2927978 RepID=A0ABQ5QHB6_9BACT|nr:DciA family protein [Geothrix limicola]GLH74067.1 hypothetical protein GETHLI_25690 [Geothrix limicola]
MKRTPRLVPLGARQPNQKAEARLRQAWPFVVGPALAERTRPLRVERDILVMGCWELSRIAPLREAATAVWPQMRDRIERALGLSLRGLQIVPCDPPPKAPDTPKEADPLRRALRLLEARRQERIRLGLESE